MTTEIERDVPAAQNEHSDPALGGVGAILPAVLLAAIAITLLDLGLRVATSPPPSATAPAISFGVVALSLLPIGAALGLLAIVGKRFTAHATPVSFGLVATP